MTAYPLARLHASRDNARTVVEPPDDLIASMKTLGQIQPIVVWPDGQDAQGPLYAVVCGARRFAAAQALGWDTINAVEIDHHEGIDPLAVSAAENMVRAAMHPIDCWRAVRSLTDMGTPLQSAADALGISLRYARRLHLLGSMAPEVIAVIAETSELPDERFLPVIASAPPEKQAEAIKAGRRKRSQGIDWFAVANHCRVDRIARTKAIFATDLLDWDEDLFAQPTDEDRFTTSQTADFIRLQTEALRQKAARSKGRIVVTRFDRQGNIDIPDGWIASWNNTPRKKGDPQRIVACAVATDGYRLGEVIERVCIPKPTREPRVADNGDEEVVEARTREPVTKAVQAHLAALKGAAVREQLSALAVEWAESDNLFDPLRALLLTFAARNLRCQSNSRLDGIVRRLIDDNGNPTETSTGDICLLTAAVIGTIINFDHPNTNFGTSGPAAEWIATIIGAAMPRCDTAEVLKGVVSREMLTDLAKANGIPTDGTMPTLRKRLEGKLPDWRPVTFGAPGPKAHPMDRYDEDDEETDEQTLDRAAADGILVDGDC